ncbi:hypothetical protein pipiens_019104 [Culex pipiens pipiens]|uniref:Vezatin n=1 Tax=Culex pipiens pipiens TaxID=38569 RepID=A0ABD1DWC2_CULPP
MNRFYPEIEGKRTFQRNMILQTLNSKRLLIDHVEILEECLATIDSPESPSFTTAKFLALTSIAATSARMLLPYRTAFRWTLPAIAFTTAAYTTCYSLKLARRFHFRRQEASLTGLITSLDRFEAAIRRNLLFLNDAQHATRTTKLAQQDCFAGNCVRTCMAAIRRIHEAVTGLERNYELDERWRDVYAPMEALEDCELFAGEEVDYEVVKGAAGVRTIKDLYNIYAYVQSQFLTRLALAVACGLSDLSFCKLTELSTGIDALRVVKTLPPEVANLRSLSTALSMKMLKTVHQYNQLEELLQESTQHYEDSNFINQLPSLELSLADISSELVASDEECQRLLILVKKLANKEDPLPQLPPPSEQQPEVDPAPTYSAQYNPPQKDEFFAVDGNEARDSDGNEDRPPDELEHIDSRIVKRHFRPVLQQLRERIEPIGVEFRKREKRALQDKGIQLEEEEEVPTKNTLYSSSDSEDESEETERKDKKFQRSVERYDDVRGFLAAKQQMNIFGIMPAMGNGMEEEVLE